MKLLWTYAHTLWCKHTAPLNIWILTLTHSLNAQPKIIVFLCVLLQIECLWGSGCWSDKTSKWKTLPWLLWNCIEHFILFLLCNILFTLWHLSFSLLLRVTLLIFIFLTCGSLWSQLYYWIRGLCSRKRMRTHTGYMDASLAGPDLWPINLSRDVTWTRASNCGITEPDTTVNA